MKKHPSLNIIALICLLSAVISCKKSSVARTFSNGHAFDLQVGLTNRIGYVTQSSPTNVTVTMADNFVATTNKDVLWTDIGNLEDLSHTEMMEKKYDFTTSGPNNISYRDTVPTLATQYCNPFTKKDTTIKDSIYNTVLIQKNIVFTKQFATSDQATQEVNYLLSIKDYNSITDYIHYQFGLVTNKFEYPVYAEFPVFYKLK